MCDIPNTTTYSGIHRRYFPPSIAASFQICKICFVFVLFVCCCFLFFCLFFSVTVRSFRDGSPVYSLTFVDVKRRGLDRRPSDLNKRIASRF